MTDKPKECDSCHKKTLIKIKPTDFGKDKYEWKCSFCGYFTILTERKEVA